MTPATATDRSFDALVALRRARRRNRLGDRGVTGRLYDAFVTAVTAAWVVWLLTALLGGSEVTAAQAGWVVANGPALAGVAVAIAILFGLRSGAGGGPLNLDAAVVQYELLSPVQRARALRGPALQTIGRYALFGVVMGAVAGALAACALAGNPVGVILRAAAVGALAGATAASVAVAACGARAPAWFANLFGLALVAAAVADWVAGTTWAPTTSFGELALAQVRGDPVALAFPIALAAISLVGALRLVGGASIEASRQRAGLVESLRFAVGVQDLRQVVRLRRQLAAERPRARPWIRLAIVGRGGPARRAVRGLLRFPAVRVARMLLLGAVAGAALALSARVLALLLVAALCLLVAGYDAVDALAEETERPTRWQMQPRRDPQFLIPFVAVAAVAMAPVAVAAAATAIATACFTGGCPASEIALLAWSGLLGAAGAVVGASVSMLLGPADLSRIVALSAGMPEGYGLMWMRRLITPLVVAIVAVAPALAVRGEVEVGTVRLPVAAWPLSEVAVIVIVAGLMWIATRRPRRL